MNTATEVGQAVRDVLYKRECSLHEAARDVLKTAKANGGFGDTFLFHAVLEAERALVTAGLAVSPAAMNRPGQPIRFDDDDEYSPLDMEIPVPRDGTHIRMQIRDLTREDAAAIGAWYKRSGTTMMARGRWWEQASTHIPEDKTLGDVWDKLPASLRGKLRK